METPPNNSIGRPNFMQFRRGAEGEEDAFRNDNLLNRTGSSNFVFYNEGYPYRK